MSFSDRHTKISETSLKRGGSFSDRHTKISETSLKRGGSFSDRHTKISETSLKRGVALIRIHLHENFKERVSAGGLKRGLVFGRGDIDMET